MVMKAVAEQKIEKRYLVTGFRWIATVSVPVLLAVSVRGCPYMDRQLSVK